MSKKMVRWSLAMSRFEYDIVYRKGKTNISDALSRLEPAVMPVMEQKSLKQRIIGEQKNDAECRAAVEFLKSGKMMVADGFGRAEVETVCEHALVDENDIFFVGSMV